MKQTLVGKLVPDAEQHAALVETMERFNAACDAIATVAFREHTASKFALQKLAYYDIRRDFGLSAQMTVRAISKVAEAYKRDKNVQPRFRPHGAIVYDERILSWKGPDRVSLLTLAGRQLIPIRFGGYAEGRLDRIKGQADLVYRDGMFYLAVTIDLPEPPPEPASDWLGIDVGIVNILSDSDGRQYSGAQVNGLRARHRKLRKRLQAKGTKSAKQLLKKRRRKERRFARQINHVLSKRVVAIAKDTERGIALEDLRGIRERTTVRKAQRATHASWSFGQLRQFIAYKAAMAAVPVVAVDPRNTSRTCPGCGHVAKENRRTQASFQCVSCGFAGSADTIAAINIGRRAAVMQPYAAAFPG